MLRHAGVEAVGREEFLTLEQAKAGFRHDHVQIRGLGADRAVAFCDREAGGSADFEPDPAAVAAAGVNYSIQ
jgi:hypothetical protein